MEAVALQPLGAMGREKIKALARLSARIAGARMRVRRFYETHDTAKPGGWGGTGVLGGSYRRRSSQFFGVSLQHGRPPKSYPCWRAQVRTPCHLHSLTGKQWQLYLFSSRDASRAGELAAAAAVNYGARLLYNTDDILILLPGWEDMLSAEQKERIEDKVVAFKRKAKLLRKKK